MSAIEEFLTINKIKVTAELMRKLQELGVENVNDLQFVEMGDLEKTGMMKEYNSCSINLARPKFYTGRKGMHINLISCGCDRWDL